MIEMFVRYLPDIIGMIGVILILIAYFWLSMGQMEALSMSYQLLNLLGAVGILISLCFTFNLSSFVIEVAWIVISVIGMYKTCQQTKSS